MRFQIGPPPFGKNVLPRGNPQVPNICPPAIHATFRMAMHFTAHWRCHLILFLTLPHCHTDCPPFTPPFPHRGLEKMTPMVDFMDTSTIWWRRLTNFRRPPNKGIPGILLCFGLQNALNIWGEAPPWCRGIATRFPSSPMGRVVLRWSRFGVHLLNFLAYVQRFPGSIALFDLLSGCPCFSLYSSKSFP